MLSPFVWGRRTLIRQATALDGVLPNDNRKIGKDASVLKKAANTFMFVPSRAGAIWNTTGQSYLGRPAHVLAQSTQPGRPRKLRVCPTLCPTPRALPLGVQPHEQGFGHHVVA